MATTNDMPDLFVVDGSNIATEGSDKPSLEQLNEAVAAFRSEYPKLKLTVVVDATFGHRIAKKEVKAFDKAVATNEIVTPPAGAVGRGDAFILAIADKAGAGVLSNDSFQEFHGEYGWLFEHGRLIGGKPVPHVGWVFVDRNPVRGRRSRESIKAAKQSDSSPTEAKEQARRRVRKKKAAADTAAEPTEEQPAETIEAPAEEPVSAPDPESAGSGGSRRSRGGRRRGGRGGSKRAAGAEAAVDTEPSAEPARVGSHVNELMPFLDFVEQHPVGTAVSGTVDSYSSHGAYAKVGDVQVYVPLRLMAKPAPTSARKMLTLGDPIELVIVGFVPDRRSIDGALPGVADVESRVADAASDASPDQTAGSPEQAAPAKQAAPKKKAAARKRATTKKKAAAKKAPAKKQAAAKAPAKQAAPKKQARKKAPATKKAAARRAPAKQTPAKQTPAKQTPAKKAPARKQAAAKAPAKKAAARQTPAKKAPAKKQAAAKAPAKRRARRAASRSSGS